MPGSAGRTTTTEETSMTTIRDAAAFNRTDAYAAELEAMPGRHRATCDTPGIVTTLRWAAQSERAKWLLALTPLWLAIPFALFMVLTGGHHDPAPAPAPLTLTLADAHGWTPTATLDTTQVEAPTGDADALPDPDEDTATFAALYPLLAAQADAGSDTIVRADDTDHPELSECVIVLGDTSVIVCSDGFATTS